MNLKTINLDHVYTFLLCAVAFTIPLPMLANNIAIILLIIFWFFTIFKKQVKAPPFKPLLLLLIPYVIFVLGAFYSLNHKQLSTELTKTIPFLLLPVITFSVPFKIDVSRFKTILKWFVIGNFIIGLILIAVIIKTLVIEGLSLKAFWGITHQQLAIIVDLNAIYLSLYFAICLLFITFVFLYKKREITKPLKFFYAISFLLFCMSMVFLSSRTVILSCSVLVSLLILQYYFKRMPFFKVMLRFLLIGFIFSGAVFFINPVLKMRMESVFFDEDFDNAALKEEGVQMRQKLWSSSYEVFKDHFLFGVGTGDFEDELMETYKKNKHRVQYRFQMNSHNQYLSFMVGSGIVGTLFFLLYMFYPVSVYILHKKWLLLMITLLFVFCFFTESYLYANKGVIVVSFFMTIMYKHYLDTKLKFQNEQA